MHLDIATILFIACLVTGAIWLADLLVFKPRRVAAAAQDDGAVADEAQPASGTEPMAVEYSRSIFPVLLFVLVFRSFLWEPFHIPSSSMVPTLMIGDFILVNKFSYGLRLPVVDKKFIDIGEPQRGDVVVLRFPPDPSQDFIKRVIGLPGDRIVYHDRTLYVNGQRVTRDFDGTYSGPNVAEALRYTEHLETHAHDILLMPDRRSREGEWVVPPDEYFVMGDNRDNSNDSRYWGFVPEQNLVGKATYIWMNWDFLDAAPIWSRIGTRIQ